MNDNKSTDTTTADSVLILLSLVGLFIGGLATLVFVLDSTEDMVMRVLLGWFIASVIFHNMFKNHSHKSDIYAKNEEIDRLKNQIAKRQAN